MLSLAEQQEIGKRAEVAYNAYVKDFVAVQKEELLKLYTNHDVRDQEGIMELKRQLMALLGLEQGILNDIDTGRMATIQLEGGE